MPSRVAVIMAGGAGERFWPLSRRNRPKQLLRLASGKTLVEEAVERIVPTTGYENLYIATGADQAAMIAKAVPQVPKENILAEPLGRDTAVCMAYALAVMRRRGDDPTMAVLTADHSIGPLKRFAADCAAAYEHAEANDILLTFGIQPSRPDTGFGYIELGELVKSRRDSEIFAVQRFREKPNEETARQFLEAGHFLWNSGMFVWRSSALQKAMERHAPTLAQASNEMYEALGTSKAREALRKIFDRLPKISIDFAVMEKAENVHCLRASFEWDDIGTWSAIARHHTADLEGNVCVGEALTVGTRDCIVYSAEGVDGKAGPLIAALGVEDLIIVATGDAILVCPRNQAQRVKELTRRIREDYGNKYS